MSIRSKLETVLFNPSAVVGYLFSKKFNWRGDGCFKYKAYDSYDEYMMHQKEKLNLMGDKFLKQGKDFGRILEARLRRSGRVMRSKSVLCLGARLGYEVESFINLGCFAVGVDLNPGKDNKYVVSGDFHKLVWGDNSVDIIFTNSLDHSFNLEDVVIEIKRVLKKGGLMILEVCDGTDEGYEFDIYESVMWKKLSDVVDIFVKHGFKVVLETRFKMPDCGSHIMFRLIE